MNYQGLLFVSSLNNKIGRWYRLKMLIISVENVFHTFFSCLQHMPINLSREIVEGFLLKMRLTIAPKRIVTKFKPLLQTASFSLIWKFLWKKKKKQILFDVHFDLNFFYFEGKWFWRFENFLCVTYESTWIFRLKSNKEKTEGKYFFNFRKELRIKEKKN